MVHDSRFTIRSSRLTVHEGRGGEGRGGEGRGGEGRAAQGSVFMVHD